MKPLIALLITVSCIGYSAAAQPYTGTRSTVTESEIHPAGFSPYLGLGSGYTQYDREIDVEGVPSALKILGSYYTESKQYVFDLGLGMMTQRFSQRAAPKRSITDTSMEVAARYRWADINWQAGIVETTFFNEGRYYSANQADAQFAGVQVLKDLSLTKDIAARLGGRIMTDLNVNNRAVNMAMIDIQLGWKTSAEKNIAETAPAPAPAPVAAQPEEAKAVVTTPPTPPAVERRVIFPEPYEKLSERAHRELINTNTLAEFDVNSAKVASIAEKDIAKLAAILTKNSELFSKVEVIGHADKTGSDEKNLVLSKDRAQAVANILLKNGISDANIVISAEGSQDSADQSRLKAPVKNHRRVELKFIDVKDFAKLEQLINSL